MTESMAPYFDNNNLFDTAGCLTKSGLEALRDDRLDDLGRLEAAEHLTFCDRCLARYTARIEGQPAQNQIEEYLDEHFDDARMKQVYPKFVHTG